MDLIKTVQLNITENIYHKQHHSSLELQEISRSCLESKSSADIF